MRKEREKEREGKRERDKEGRRGGRGVETDEKEQRQKLGKIVIEKERRREGRRGNWWHGKEKGNGREKGGMQDQGPRDRITRRKIVNSIKQGLNTTMDAYSNTYRRART